MIELARCYACGEDKPVGEFSPDRSKASGRMSICRACVREKSRVYYRANRERVLARMAARRGPPKVATCPTCGERFTNANGRQRYCKPSHRPSGGDRGAKVEAVCDWCGRDFIARARDRARGLGRFCCKSHAQQGRNSPAALAARDVEGSAR
jgi:hypothetical protein